MKRWFWNTVFVLGLAFWGASAGLWARSKLVRDFAWVVVPWTEYGGERRLLQIDFDSGGGQVELSFRPWTERAREELSRRNELGRRRMYHRSFPQVPQRYSESVPPTLWNRLGFKHYQGSNFTSVFFPWWLAVGLGAIAPGVWLWGWWRRRRRVREGKCVSCGYDLRASSERCPECGRPIQPVAAGAPV